MIINKVCALCRVNHYKCNRLCRKPPQGDGVRAPHDITENWNEAQHIYAMETASHDHHAGRAIKEEKK